MKSNVCKIEKGTKDLAAILKESERVAEYNGLTHKQTLQLRRRQQREPLPSRSRRRRSAW